MIRGTVVEGEEHRGVALFYRHNLVQHIHHIEKSVDQVWFQLTFIPQTWWGACYIPPRDSPFFRNDSFSRIQEYCAKGKVIILGDLNARLPNLTVFNSLDVHYSENPDKGTNQNGKDLESICTDYKLVPLNHRSTPNHTFEGGMTFRQGQRWVSQLGLLLDSTGGRLPISHFTPRIPTIKPRPIKHRTHYSQRRSGADLQACECFGLLW